MNGARLTAAGVDWKDGVARCAQNAVLYERLLARFLADDSAEKAAAAFAAGDLDAAADRLHALKGTSGNVGVTAVYRLSADMLTQLRERELDKLPERFLQLTRLCGEAAVAIRAALEG